jgi:hypothetical protein
MARLAVVMPVCDSDIPMNVPITFRNKRPFHSQEQLSQ